MSKFLASKSDKHLHKWGFKDSGFKSIGDKVVKFSGDRYEVSGTEMPDFIPYIEKMLDIEIEDNDKLKEVDEKFVSPSKVDKKFYQELEKILTAFPLQIFKLSNHIGYEICFANSGGSSSQLRSTSNSI